MAVKKTVSKIKKSPSQFGLIQRLVKRFDTPKNNFYLVAVAVIILAAFFIFLNPPNKAATVDNKDFSASSGATINEVSKPKNIAYKGHSGQTAFDLLKASFPYTASGEGANSFVTSINGYKSDTSKEFWAFYVNGKQAEVGAGSYVTKADDLIEWKLEQIVK